MLHGMTIDVEDWFHILDAAEAPKQQLWDEQPSRLERNLSRLLDLLAQYRVRTTQFWLGWAAERFPGLARRAVAEGHEIASHGHRHLLVYEVGREAFAEDLRRSKATLEQIAGCAVRGYRAPGFSFTGETPWAYEELARAGYSYSSSVFPAARGHGGMIGADPSPHAVESAAGTVRELPITTVELCGRRLCLFGGGYLRFTPWPLLDRASALLERRGESIIYYLHPREIDPQQPRMRQLSPQRFFKYYVNLAATESKLRKLLRTRHFAPLAELLRAGEEGARQHPPG